VGDGVSALSVLHVICPQPAGSVGGADLHVLDLAEQQLRRQMRVFVLSLGNAVYKHQITARGAFLPDVPALWSPSFVPALARELRDECIDVVHGHGYSADLTAILAVGLARRRNAPSGGGSPLLYSPLTDLSAPPGARGFAPVSMRAACGLLTPPSLLADARPGA
jgi:hypothetical protein